MQYSVDYNTAIHVFYGWPPANTRIVTIMFLALAAISSNASKQAKGKKLRTIDRMRLDHIEKRKKEAIANDMKQLERTARDVVISD